MNSDDPARGAINTDPLPSGSQDNNANLRLTTDESKGAIPKTRLSKLTSKRTNNNIDEPHVINKQEVKLNGFAKGESSSHNYFSASCIGCTANGQTTKNENSSFDGAGLNIPIEREFVNGVTVKQSAINKCTNWESLNEIPQEQNLREDSSSDDNELLSISDDGCIYTYKGDNVADLPSSFYNLEILPINEAPSVEREENNSSPEMDFLEMDFDPGPSGDADSDSISNLEVENAASLPLDETTEQMEEPEPQPCCSKELKDEISPEPSTNKNENLVKAKLIPEPPNDPVPLVKSEVKLPWSCPLTDRTRTAKSLRIIKREHNSRGELVSPGEAPLNGADLNVTNLSAFHAATGKISIDNKNLSLNNAQKAMIWSHREASLKQVTQVGPSSCGATAVINVLNALRIPVPALEKVQELVKTRLRANSSPLAEYLMSRSRAGCTHRELISGLYYLSDKQLYSRFFAMYPERVVNLRLWLGYWIRNGAVPIATLNLQKSEGNIPDSWHHQMIFGVGPEGIYLTNPLECVDPDQLWPQVSSESVLLIKTEDVISRWNPKIDFPELMRISDVRWKELNVIGQIAKVIRENRKFPRLDYLYTSHVRIPAEYKAGITLVVDMNSPAFAQLRHCPELPLLLSEATASAF